ncbi:MAG: LacI family DNA-binding transcriptional regulator [Saccharofermentanales bacterium]
MATIKDLSKFTGLSVGTISNYLNNKAIKPVSRDLIAKAIQELDYTPNNVGKYLRVGKTKTVGVLTNTISTSFVSQTYAILESELLSNGYDVIFCNSHGDLKVEQQKLDFLAGRAVDCIVLFPVSCTDTDISTIKTPIITVDNSLETQKCPAIVFDDEDAAYGATSFFIKNGHQHIACITGYEDHHTTIMRKKGYKKALEESSIMYDPELVFNASFNNNKALEGSLKMLRDSNPPTAFLITSNEMLIGLLQAVKLLNLRIPEDVSYITFDDADYYNVLNKRPTYVCQSKELLGQMLYDLIYDILTDTEIKAKNLVKYVKTELIQGETVANLK